MIGFGPDGMNLGPAVLNWQNLSLLLGLFTWLGLAKFPQAQTTALITLAVARLWAVLPGLTASRPFLDNVWDILDLRRGNWAWLPGLSAGLLYLLMQTWRDMKRVETLADTPRVIGIPRKEIVRTSLLPAALRAAVPALAMGVAPLLLKPAATDATFPDVRFTRLDGRPAELPRPAVVNLWATWCGPCRSELPLLIAEARNDSHLILLNVGEPPETVRKFLNGRSDGVWLGGEHVTSALHVTGFPTTLVINSKGQVTARHLGPLTRAQLLTLQRQAKETP
ncbi:TlpA family protein disulfide reductase [Deinococcus fonticola]|uniref:TlpA family protein disulfide reductase n=1 Tax=Deinococcus fonticola TaxID=2528713 RepID=UPI001075804A|nr:TlpA disulfide reductase family protein [Deinococcus fonticola]